MRKQESAISRVLSTTIIHLGQPSPTASSNLPGSPLGTGGANEPHTPLFGLAPGGVYRAANCCQSRGALLPHHFTLTGKAGGIFSVALSMGSRPPGVTWRLVRRSPDFPLQAISPQRLSGQLLLSQIAESTEIIRRAAEINQRCSDPRQASGRYPVGSSALSMRTRDGVGRVRRES